MAKESKLRYLTNGLIKENPSLVRVADQHYVACHNL